MRILRALIVVALSLLVPLQASAQPAPDPCSQFVAGFAAIGAELGARMGSPSTCEYADPNGTGDTLQQTSTGLAFWRNSTNVPTFTDGTTHWALTQNGLVSWTGPDVDPPAVAPPVAPPPAQPAETARPVAPTTPAVGTCGAASNSWGYTFCGGSLISAPAAGFCSVFACIATFWNQTNGYVEQCRDGLLSHSGGVRGSCSSHGGNSRPLYVR